MKTIFKSLPGYFLVEKIIATATFRQSSITFLGTFLNALFGAIFYILCARFLGPANFGVLSVAILTLTLLSDIGDLGTNTGLVNFVARYKDIDEIKTRQFLKFGLKMKIAIWVLIVIIGFILSPFLASTLFGKLELITPLRIVFVGVGSLLIFSFIIHALQGLQKYWQWSFIQTATNALRLGIIVVIFFVGVMTVENTLWVYITVPIIGFVVGLRWLPKFLIAKNENTIAREFLKYNKWVALFVLVSAISSRLDTFISARLLTATELGLYSAANQVVKIVPQIVVAIGTVIAPKMASMENINELKRYLFKTQALVLGISFLGMLSIPVVLFLIPVVFGISYGGVGSIFIILFLGMLIFLISVPIHNAVIYYFSNPKVFFYLGLGHLLLIATLGSYLISRYGAIGGAYSVLVGAVFNLVIPGIWVFGKLNSKVNN